MAEEKLYIGDRVVVTSTEGVYEGYLVTRAIARPLVITDKWDEPGPWFKVPGEVQKVEKWIPGEC